MSLTANIPRQRIFIVVPAFNEGSVIRATLRPLVKAGYSVVVVDDGSSDDTWTQLKGQGLHRVPHPFNMGQGAALQTGVSYALAQRAAFIVHFDADGQHSPEDIEGLLAPLMSDESDVVLGSRFLRREDWQAVPLARRILLRGAVIVNGIFTGMWLTDAHNGARAFTRAAAESIYLTENGFAHATEILQLIKSSRLRYVERPTRIRYTEYSQKKGQRAWNAVNIFLDLVIRRLLR